jgi:hypothetical protein
VIGVVLKPIAGSSEYSVFYVTHEHDVERVQDHIPPRKHLTAHWIRELWTQLGILVPQRSKFRLNVL